MEVVSNESREVKAGPIGAAERDAVSSSSGPEVVSSLLSALASRWGWVEMEQLVSGCRLRLEGEDENGWGKLDDGGSGSSAAVLTEDSPCSIPCSPLLLLLLSAGGCCIVAVCPRGSRGVEREEVGSCSRAKGCPCS